MRAVVLHGPGDLRVEDVADPVLPPGGLVIEVAAVGICGSDVRSWRHGSPRLRGPQVPGHETAGVVSASDTPEVRVGTPVAVVPGAPCGTCRACRAGAGNLCPTRRVLGYDLPGGMAEAMAVPADWLRVGGVVALPPDRPVARRRARRAAPYGHQRPGPGARRGRRRGPRPRPWARSASCTPPHARSLGATVHAADPDPDRVALAARLLPDVAVDRLDDGWPARLHAASGAVGPDVVIVAVGRREAVATAIERVAPGGRILAFAGFPPDARTLELDGNDLHYRQLTIAGAFGGTPETFRRAAAWLAAHALDLDALTPGALRPRRRRVGVRRGRGRPRPEDRPRPGRSPGASP